MNKDETFRLLSQTKMNVDRVVNKAIKDFTDKIRANGVKYFVDKYESYDGNHNKISTIKVNVFDFMNHTFNAKGFMPEMVPDKYGSLSGDYTKIWQLADDELNVKMLTVISAMPYELEYLQLIETPGYGIKQQVFLHKDLDKLAFGEEWFDTYEEALARAKTLQTDEKEIQEGNSIKYQKEQNENI